MTTFEELYEFVSKANKDVVSLLAERRYRLDSAIRPQVDMMYLNAALEVASSVVSVINQYKAQYGKY